MDVETRKKAVAELSKLKADLARNGHVSAAEASRAAPRSGAARGGAVAHAPGQR